MEEDRLKAEEERKVRAEGAERKRKEREEQAVKSSKIVRPKAKVRFRVPRFLVKSGADADFVTDRRGAGQEAQGRQLARLIAISFRDQETPTTPPHQLCRFPLLPILDAQLLAKQPQPSRHFANARWPFLLGDDHSRWQPQDLPVQHDWRQVHGGAWWSSSWSCGRCRTAAEAFRFDFAEQAACSSGCRRSRSSTSLGTRGLPRAS